MQQAIEQAGSIFTGWISSCLFCLDSKGDDESTRHQQAMKQKGTEREMQICHAQPHLVPPMKLVLYDDLPSPGPPPRASSFPTWVMEESRNLASRASNRASMSLKRKSTAPVRISAPTDFRRVPTLPLSSSRDFLPLKLSFDSPLSPLPDLPQFTDFHLEEDHPQLPTQPAKALSYTTELTRTRTHRPSSSFNLPRKPVGSGSRRSSLATLELLLEKSTPPSNPLIPHFSTRISTHSVATGLATSAFASPPVWQDATVGSGTPLKNEVIQAANDAVPLPSPKTPTPTAVQNRSPPTPPTKGSPSSGSSTSSPSHANRVTQWLLQTNNAKPFPPPPASPGIWKTSFSEKIPFRIRSRTLSGSTLAPSITSIAGSLKPTPPLSSSTATVRTSTLDSRIEKDLELPIARPYAPRHTMSEDQPYPTIFEGEQHQYQARQQGVGYEGVNYSYYNDHRHSAVGVAF